MSNGKGKAISADELDCLNELMAKLEGSMKQALVGKIQSAVKLYQGLHVAPGIDERIPEVVKHPNIKSAPSLQSLRVCKTFASDASSAEKTAAPKPSPFISWRNNSKKQWTDVANSYTSEESTQTKREHDFNEAKCSRNAGDEQSASAQNVEENTTVARDGAEQVLPPSIVQAAASKNSGQKHVAIESENLTPVCILSDYSEGRNSWSASEKISEKDPSVDFDVIGGSEDEFLDRLQTLRVYMEEHSHVVVQSLHRPELKTWCRSLRRAHRYGILPHSRRRALDDLGFEWDDAAAKRFAKFLCSLRLFEEEFSTGRVGQKQTSWFQYQLRLLRAGKASADRCAVLEDSECFQAHLSELEMVAEVERSKLPPEGTRVLAFPREGTCGVLDAHMRRKGEESTVGFENEIPTIDDGINSHPLFDIQPVWTGSNWV